VIGIKLKAQSWSLDISLGLIIFISAFFIVYSLLNENPNTKAKQLSDDATVVLKQLTSEDALYRLVDNNEVNATKVRDLKNVNYEELKRRLRIEGDFCIYFQDDKGNIILIDNTYRSIGSPNINLNNVPCS